MKLSVIIPCFNEARTIRDVVARVKISALPNGWEKEIIVVDDGSTDGTAEVLRTIPPEDAKIILSEVNKGKGAAVKTGLAQATGEYAVIQDADMEYDPADYALLLAPILQQESDSVFGSRNLGTNSVPVSNIYYYGGLLTTIVFNIVFFTKFTDIATCYKVFPRKFFAALIASDHNDFVFDSVDLTRTLELGGSIVEVPIHYSARSKNEGKKLNWKQGIKIVSAIFLTRFGFGSSRHLVALGRFIRYFISGTSAALINIVLLYVLTEYAGLWYLVSSLLSFILAFAFNFVAQKYWVFKSDDNAKIKRELPLQLGVNLMNLILNTALLYILVEYAHIWYVFSQSLSSIILAFESYFLYKWIFK